MNTLIPDLKTIFTYSNNRPLSPIDAWCLGIVVVIGGQYFGWNFGLAAGFGSFFIATFLVGTAFLSLVLCLVELACAIPFSGIGFGLCRIVLGHYYGFMVGMLEALEYTLYVAACSFSLGSMMTNLTGSPTHLEPLWYLMYYLVSLYSMIFHHSITWAISFILAVVSFMIILIYCFGSIQHFDNNNLKSIPYFNGGFVGFMCALPLASWFYVGIESLVLLTDQFKSPKQGLTRGMLLCMLTLLSTSLLVLITCAGQQPIDSLATELSPLNLGFENIFKVKYSMGTAFALPASFATMYGFLFVSGNQVKALSESTLLPRVLAYSYRESATGALLASSAMGFLTCILMFYVPSFAHSVFLISSACAFIVFIGIMVCYCVYISKFKLEVSESNFENPFGIYAAIYGILVFGLCLISTLIVIPYNGYINGSKADICVPFIIIGIIIVSTCYYLKYVQIAQFFSEQEKKYMLSILVMQKNFKSREGLRKSKTGAISRLNAAMHDYLFTDDGSKTNEVLKTLKPTQVTQINENSSKIVPVVDEVY